MRHVLLATLMLMYSWAAAQECTTYVVVNAFEQQLKVDVNTLKPHDFDARANGSPLEIVSADQDYSSRLLVLVEVDEASSNDKIADVVDVVTRQARQAPEGKPLAFGVYAAKAEFTQGFFANTRERTRAINDIIETGDSLGKRVAMFDALRQAVRMFGEHQPGDTILLVASPYDDKSDHSASDVEKEFLANGVRLLVMLREPLTHVGRDFTWRSHEPEKRALEELTQKTGGAFTDFDPHFFGWNWRGYMVGVKVPEQRHKSLKWTMHLLGRGFHKTKLFYPEQLPPCGNVTAAGGSSR
jgi:hypothetical protein